jgi:D-alanine transaminase
MPDIFYYRDRFLAPEETPVPIEERGHQFGDGVYEVVRVYGGRPFLLDWHLDRFERSLSVLEMANPFSRQEWVELITEAIRRSGFAEAQVYWQVTRGIAARLHTFPASPTVPSLTVHAATPKHKPSGETQLLALPDDRWANAYVKSINLLPNVVAKENAKRAGAVEALYVRSGVITEGAGSNAFFVRDGKLYTAPANRFILGGITRRFVIELARLANIPVVEQAISLDDLETVDEVFMTSSTQEILPIQSIVVSRNHFRQLHALPEAAPEHLVCEPDELLTLWRTNAVPGQLTERLDTAFQAFVEEFRKHGVTLPGDISLKTSQPFSK